jgi:hypothetical protein
MNPLNPRAPLLRRILTSRLIRYPVYLFLLLTFIGIFLPEDTTLETAQYLHAGPNPWRDLPADQETALKEVLFITETLRDTFLPTSLPEEDDYEFLSKLLRSLETREDISWTTLLETGADRTVMAIANRHQDFAAEPFQLTERFKELDAHWDRLKREDSKPEQWEIEHDTTFLPALLKARELDGEGAVETDGGLTEGLSDDQREKMEERYAEWRKNRDRLVSYLKIHPPRPIAWAPLPKEEVGRRAAWEEVMEGGVVEDGKQVAESVVAASPNWKPIYRSLDTEDVPIGWLTPGEKEMTPEEALRWLERLQRLLELANERSRKQKEMQEKLKAERVWAQRVKNEL